jgi:hypothetical protein
MNIISKEDAIKLTQKWYFTGEPCQNDHIERRYTNTGICYGCKREINKRNRINNSDTFKKRSKRNYIKHVTSIKKRNQKWAEENRDKSRAIKQKWHNDNIEFVRSRAREYSREQRKDPSKRISRNLSKAIWQSLNGKKGGKTWLSFVDFTVETLQLHLENKFKPGMTWDNYGRHWHVDHIKPLSWFDLETEFKDAWCLENLQPLEATLNLSKNNRYIG